MRILLDTNAYSALHRGHEAVIDFVRRSEEVLLSTVVAGELLFGFHHGSRYEANTRGFHAFLEAPNVRQVPLVLSTAEYFGRISTALRRLGKPIPTNDIWIAAHAMDIGATLVSSDSHFEDIEGLSWLTFTA